MLLSRPCVIVPTMCGSLIGIIWGTLELPWFPAREWPGLVGWMFGLNFGWCTKPYGEFSEVMSWLRMEPDILDIRERLLFVFECEEWLPLSKDPWCGSLWSLRFPGIVALFK